MMIDVMEKNSDGGFKKTGFWRTVLTALKYAALKYWAIVDVRKLGCITADIIW